MKIIENLTTIRFSTIKRGGVLNSFSQFSTNSAMATVYSYVKKTVNISLICHQWYRCNFHRNVIKKQLSSSSVQYSIQLFISILFKQSLESFAFLCKTHQYFHRFFSKTPIILLWFWRKCDEKLAFTLHFQYNILLCL